MLCDELCKFVVVCGWQQFYVFKNLVMVLSVEIVELVEIFQWLMLEQSYNFMFEQCFVVQDEIVDVLVYLIEMVDVLGIDLFVVVCQKFVKNVKKYFVFES